MRKSSLFVAAAAIGAIGLSPSSSQAAKSAFGMKVVSAIAAPDGGWDYASFDAARRRIYVAQGMRVLMIDADTHEVLPTLAAGNHLHAVVPVPGTDLLVTTNSGDNTARIISAVDGKLVASVPTAADADSALYDPASGDVLVVGGDSGQIDWIDPKAAKVVGSMKVGGKLEFLALDGKGKLFVNDEENHKIVGVDLATKAVVSNYDLPGCVSPTGLAMAPEGRLISACANGVAKIIDAASGREIASLKIGPRPDAVILDAERGFAYIPSGGSGDLAVIALTGGRNNEVVGTIPTQKSARTGTLDPKTGHLYLPAADYLPPAGAGQRPGIKPGTFRVLDIGPG